MAENNTIQDKSLDMPCKHKNHTSLKHIGLKLACQDSSCKRPFKGSKVKYFNFAITKAVVFFLLTFCMQTEQK